MAKKYCRYCSSCILGDVFFCTAQDKVLHRIDRAVNCKDFTLSELGDVETGRQYKPKIKSVVQVNQIGIFESEVQNV
jgi:hypothetical protein